MLMLASGAVCGARKVYTAQGELLWDGARSAGTWTALPPGTHVALQSNVSIAWVQAMMEFLITNAVPFHGKPGPGARSALSRVEAAAPPRDVAYVWARSARDRTSGLRKADLASVTLRKAGLGQDAEAARSEAFVKLVKRERPVSDKVTAHSYQTIYGALLTPETRGTVRKFLEIGLGCHMWYGAGASVRIWAELLPQAERWEAEFDEACVTHTRDKLVGINVLTGDQGNRTTLARWIATTGGSFDMIVDDGGHYNEQVMTSYTMLWPHNPNPNPNPNPNQVMTSYTMLWPHLSPGGIYVMEDIHVGRSARYATPYGGPSDAPADFLQSIAARLLGGATPPAEKGRTPPPDDVEWILCQAQACAFGKRGASASSSSLHPGT